MSFFTFREDKGMNFDFKILDFFKLPIKIIFAISIAAGFILFLPDYSIHKIHMYDFRAQYGFIIGSVFLTTISIILVTITVSIYNYTRNKYYWKKFIDTAKDRLLNLTDYQKVIVYYLYQKDNHTSELPFNDGSVRLLKEKLIITETTTQYMAYDLNNPIFPYMLNPWVVETMTKDENLADEFLKIYKNTCKNNIV